MKSLCYDFRKASVIFFSFQQAILVHELIGESMFEIIDARENANVEK